MPIVGRDIRQTVAEIRADYPWLHCQWVDLGANRWMVYNGKASIDPTQPIMVGNWRWWVKIISGDVPLGSAISKDAVLEEYTERGYPTEGAVRPVLEALEKKWGK
ncbi:hypothetical protein ACFP2T_43325 [Plantactinospora solaniradicis]|uniref:Uncharacterized protein n=1 Tax=Plantactinospora solaniradicis TaxID=1723736 RepID=A0ABW1KND9_9ACTN